MVAVLVNGVLRSGADVGSAASFAAAPQDAVRLLPLERVDRGFQK